MQVFLKEKGGYLLSDLLELELQVVMRYLKCMLGTKLMSLARAASTLNCGSISRVLSLFMRFQILSLSVKTQFLNDFIYVFVLCM